MKIVSHLSAANLARARRVPNFRRAQRTAAEASSRIAYNRVCKKELILNTESAIEIQTTIQIAQIVPFTEAEGPGRRFAVWFQGCPLRCPECCNPEMLPFSGGESIEVDHLTKQVRAAVDEHQIEGVTLLGGEPFAHADGAAIFARAVRSYGLTVMAFSGYLLEEIQKMPSPAVQQLLDHTDILVDGPYQRDQPESERRWIGSSNQRIHFLTDRYREGDNCWEQPNTLEIRYDGTDLIVNGFPAMEAVGLWKRTSTADDVSAESTPPVGNGARR